MNTPTVGDPWRPTLLRLKGWPVEEYADKVTVHVLDKDTRELVAEVEIHVHRTRREAHESYGITVRSWSS